MKGKSSQVWDVYNESKQEEEDAVERSSQDGEDKAGEAGPCEVLVGEDAGLDKDEGRRW